MMPSRRVLVLGGTGMLGSMMCRVFRESGFDVIATQRINPGAPGYLNARDPVPALDSVLRNGNPLDAVINCIGLTRVDSSSPASIEEGLLVNGLFPWRVGHAAHASGVRVVHISTDAVFRGRSRPYLESAACDAADMYGLSKRAGEVMLPNVLSIRTSIVGPDQGGRGLLEWFLRHADRSEVSGFTNHVWNGVTTRQLAEFAVKLLQDEAFERLRTRSAIVHFSPNRPLSKYQLLVQINRAYGRQISVKPVPGPTAVTRILSSRLSGLPPMPSRQSSIFPALRALAQNVAHYRGNPA